MNILGINAFHGDSSAALVCDGEVVLAAEEERFRRIKHWAGFPSEAIRWCLEDSKLRLDQIDYIAINQDPGAHFVKKILFTLSKRPSPRFLFEKLTAKKERLSVRDHLAESFPGVPVKVEVRQIEHHRSHLASAFYPSGFDEAWVVSIDGFGDFASAAWGIGRGNDISIQDRILFPDSMGIFYQAVTQYLGFPKYGDEYKVMGMAPYGKPAYLDELRQLVHSDRGRYQLNLDFFRHHKESIAFEWKGGSPEFDNIYSPALIELLGEPRDPAGPVEQKHFDIAYSAQALYEERFFELLNELQSQHALPNLALAGGCAMNSVANGKIYRNTSFQKAYMQPASGDAGGAVGAALAVWHEEQTATAAPRKLIHAYLGPRFDNDYVESLLDQQRQALDEANCVTERVEDRAEISKRTATAISEGQVIGWFQGRMEWGPRALGNRSILCDPRRADMKDILNLKIKRRESFRPFAPAILREETAQWFEEEDDVPFMMKVFQIREEKRSLIPAVTHVDGSGRLQTVTKEANDRYHQLISAFNEISGVPILLNTSFNENEPIVCTPEEALACFLRTDMDLLVMEDWMIWRQR